MRKALGYVWRHNYTSGHINTFQRTDGLIITIDAVYSDLVIIFVEKSYFVSLTIEELDQEAFAIHLPVIWGYVPRN